MPTRKSFDQIKAAILKPAMTSQFQVYVTFPQEVQTYLQSKDINLSQDGNRQDTLNLSCVEASLPGSSLATLELTSDHTGVTERHVHRRMFDDRIDLTFYVDADNYLPIKAFEFWKEYIVSGSSADQTQPTDLASAVYYHRMKYPDSYITGGGNGGGELRVVKFERDFDGSFKGNNGVVNPTANGLTYNFVRAFPIAVASIPISYEASSLLKCTVSMSYIRYFISNGLGDSKNNTETTADDPADTNSETTPASSQSLNSIFNSLSNIA